MDLGGKPMSNRDDQDVLDRLEHAGRTLLCLNDGSGGGRCVWPFAILPDPAEAYGYTAEVERWPTPSPSDITRMDEAFAWLALIPEDRFVLRRIVGLRCLVHPISGRHLNSWRRIGGRLHCSHEAARRWQGQAIGYIGRGLSVAAPETKSPVRRFYVDTLPSIRG
jgi:hypothetical protein